MRLVYSEADPNLEAAVRAVNALADDQAFWDGIAARPGFDHTEHTGAAIAVLMRAHPSPVRVEHYRRPWPFHRNTNAYADPDAPNVIFYNEKKLWRSVPDMVNTLAHEFVHVVDHAEPGSPAADFTHDGQGEQGNENAAPNWIGDHAQRCFERAGG